MRTCAPESPRRWSPKLEGLVIAHPMREPLAGLLMRALHASGRRGAALEVYEQTRKRLADQLGVDPSAELAALHLEILRDEPARVHRTNLRAELTSFVGRDAELAHVAALVGAHRLITLTGPGGAGKTRLAVEAARAELNAMPGGVWLVELAPVTDPAEVPSAVLAALGLREQALLYPRGPLGAPADEQADALGRLLAALAGQRALLVLDNCEHLVAAAAVLADRVLAACPQVRIMTTSREPLNITGEALWTVGPLTLPPDPAVRAIRPNGPGCVPLSKRQQRPAWTPSPRFACSRSERARSGPGSGSPRATRPPWLGSVARSTACHWLSSWPRPGCAPWPPSRSRPASTIGSSC